MQNLFQLHYFRYFFEHLHFHTALIVRTVVIVGTVYLNYSCLFVHSFVCV